ncbi:uncharacterized protein LOC110021811 isoform X2 [Phalaenopsis equestris]|nr:uncharacterized protein LOC110021811 isoform X2 [Phalaenopsis equestris]XP_020576128.1 uncharacterized protein LOC110021811 isoform X2 [Phalaenopsis equestris]
MENGAMVLDLQAQGEEISWKQDLEIFQSQVDSLRDKLLELKVGIQRSENVAKSELDLLWCKVATISALLTSLKSKARNMVVMHLSQCSCVAKHEDGRKLSNVDVALCDCSKDVNPSYEILAKETSLTSNFNLGSLEANDRTYTGEVLRSVGMVTDIMESLVKRVIIAETEVVYEKEKVNLGLTELRRKGLQIDRMSTKVKEMENLAASTNDKLNEMRQRVEHLMQETSRQKQHAVENEQELSRVKQEFEMLRSFVNNLIRSREEALSSDSHVQTRDVFDRLVEKNSRLENETVRKEAEVQNLMDENVRLRNLLDKKEAQLLAMNEQCKFMALNKGGI